MLDEEIIEPSEVDEIPERSEPKIFLPIPIKTDKYTVPELPEYEPNAGEYHVVSLDARGNEIKGSDFSANEKAIKKVFSDTTKFKVKKNPQKK